MRPRPPFGSHPGGLIKSAPQPRCLPSIRFGPTPFFRRSIPGRAIPFEISRTHSACERRSPMAEAVYFLCALTSLACAVLLWRGYLRHRNRLLMWSSLCFVCLAINNGLLYADKVIFPDETGFWGMDFGMTRSTIAVLGLLLLLYGLVWESD